MSTDPGEREQQNTTSGATNTRPMWRRTGVWIGGVAAAALATVIAGTVTQGFGWFADVVDTQGDPVEVRVEVEARMDDVVLSPDATLSTDERAQLSSLSPVQQVEWFEENEQAAVSGTRKVTLYLTGNRTGTVRITDLTSIEECEPIARGTLVRMMSGRGAGVESEVVHIDVGEGGSDAYVLEESGEQHDYFPERTITLTRDEELPLVVNLVPDFNGTVCDVELELTVWDGNAEHPLRVAGPDGPFVVMSIELAENEPEYGAVYLGGEVCRQYVPAVPNWSSRPPCGEGGFAQ